MKKLIGINRDADAHWVGNGFPVSIGVGSDTIARIAGGIARAYHGGVAEPITHPSGEPMMSEPSPSPDRRAFLRQTLAAAAAGPLAIAADSRARGVSPSAQEEADAFLASYVEGWLPRETVANKAAWVASTDVTEAHTAEQVARDQALSEFVGAPRVIETVRRLLSRKAELDEQTARQLEKVRLRAAEAPGTAPEVVKARNLAEAAQSAAQDGFAYTRERPGEPDTHPTPNDLDRVLVESRDLAERRDAWEVSKTSGGPLREGLLRLRDLRNRVAGELGFDSFFALQVADYGLTAPEMVALTDGFLAEVRPLYGQLHTWAKHTLAARYGAEVPEGPIPAHWLPNRWGLNWPGLVEGVDLDPPLRAKSRAFIVEQAEQFYVSLGFPKLPQTFYTRSDLYPADPASGRKKNSHASAWHVDLRDDVRSLMSVEPDSRWFTTAHHELGHIYYYISYSTPRVPYLLRGGANRAFHEAIGDLIGLAAGSRAYIDSIGLLPAEAAKAEPVTWLLDTALDSSSVVFLPFAAGVMTHFERDFYAGDIEADSLNRSWWDLVRRHQGIVPPGPRPESLCDPATKTHINDDPGQYYDYAIGTVIKFQLHDHIARKILGQDPRDCNYYGNRKVGDFLREILSAGATRDWNTVLRQATGSSLTARPLVAYFEPLARWLEEQNQGRKVGWS